ncbi:MAG: 16S rRNA (cytosine(1402)-N(4))-methyltransferase RsmH [Gemmatimonadetes bacterium]|nr:16S rRNA (cytosine(1402)-N(4))-methyltransferase RsmH [Gemmatimonadota bacterium]
MSNSRYDSPYHAPVMVSEVLALLAGAAGHQSGAAPYDGAKGDGPSDGGGQSVPRILDCTLGGGGHSAALLDAGADVTGIDRDPTAIEEAGARLSTFVATGRFRAIQSTYAEFAESDATPAPFDGVLLDLGVSSHQFDDESRGFSFREGAPLDMRMSAGNGPGAADLLNEADESELTAALRDFGDERRAARMAAEIVRRRANRPFATSDDLVGVVRAVLGPRSGPPEFARIFQAIRIAVNDELPGLARALPALRDRLAPSGVIAVITYHSGEDRLIKHTFREWSRACTCPPRQPICMCGGDNALGDVVTRRAVAAAADEIVRNARARSAKLRAWRRRASPPTSKRN